VRVIVMAINLIIEQRLLLNRREENLSLRVTTSYVGTKQSEPMHNIKADSEYRYQIASLSRSDFAPNDSVLSCSTGKGEGSCIVQINSWSHIVIAHQRKLGSQ
jgi:hypothetical protein